MTNTPSRTGLYHDRGLMADARRPMAADEAVDATTATTNTKSKVDTNGDPTRCEMHVTGHIYCFLNVDRDIPYIGQTARHPDQREREHRLRCHNHAIRKHISEGDTFVFTVLDSKKFPILQVTGKEVTGKAVACASRDAWLYNEETRYIKEYDSYENGYNMTVGGRKSRDVCFYEAALKRSYQIYTWLQFVDVVRKSSLRTHADYYKDDWYKHDKGLPSTPHQQYPSEWRGWPYLLRNHTGFYTWEELTTRVRQDVTKRPTFWNRCRYGRIQPSMLAYTEWQKADPKCPSNPRQYYDEFETVCHFLTGSHTRVRFPKFDELCLKVQGAVAKGELKPTMKAYDQWRRAWPSGISDGSGYQVLFPAVGYLSTLYRSEWKSGRHFMTGYDFPDWLVFVERIRKAMKDGKIEPTVRSYESFRKLNSWCPSNPGQVYKDSWHSLHHLCTGQCEYIAWIRLKQIVQKVVKDGKLDPTTDAYDAWIHGRRKCPPSSKIPMVYEGDFVSFERFFHREEFYGWEELCRRVRSAIETGDMKAATWSAYNEWRLCDSRYPSASHVSQKYRDEWQGAKHFFTGNVYDTWDEVRNRIRMSIIRGELKAITESYKAWQKGYPTVPSNPNTFYDDDWRGWTHFLTGALPPYDWTKLCDRVRKARPVIRTMRKYYDWQVNESRCPYHPQTHKLYKGHWKGWHHFLTGKLPDPRPTWIEACVKVQSMNFSSVEEYIPWQKKNKLFPASPSIYYLQDWKGWGHFRTGVVVPGQLDVANKNRAKNMANKAKNMANKMAKLIRKWKVFIKSVEGEHIHNQKEYARWRRTKSATQRKPLPLYPSKTFSRLWKGWEHLAADKKL